MQDPEAQMLHVSGLILTHFRERPDNHSSQDTAALQPHAHHLLVEENLPRLTVRTISLEEFDQLILSSVQHRQPAPVPSVCSSTR